MREAAKSAFLPEFMNRIDEVVTFRALEPAQVESIARLMVDRVAERLRVERGIELAVDDALVAQLARDGFDAQFGARPLQRHIHRTLEKALTASILAGDLTDGARARRRGRWHNRTRDRAARRRRRGLAGPSGDCTWTAGPKRPGGLALSVGAAPPGEESIWR